MEKEIIVDEVKDDLKNVDDNGSSDEEDELDLDNITYEQAKKLKEDLSKASKKIAELKRAIKDKPTNKSESENFVTKEDLAIDKFLLKNPDLEEYKDDLKKHMVKGYSLEQAKLLVENDDKTIENRRKANSMNMSDGEGGSAKVYSTKELEDMPQKEYNKVMADVKAGKAKIKR